MVKRLILLVLNAQNELIEEAQAITEEAWDVAWSYLQRDRKVMTVRIIDPHTKELEGTVCRLTDKRTGKIHPSYHFDRPTISNDEATR